MTDSNRSTEADSFPMADGPRIPRGLAALIFRAYDALYGGQPLAVIERRGGFYWAEVPRFMEQLRVKNRALHDEIMRGLPGGASGNLDAVRAWFAAWESQLPPPSRPLLRLALASSPEPSGECICPKCGLRHGGTNIDGGF